MLFQNAAGELATLLTLQLGRLQPSTLAEVVEAVAELQAAPKPTWVESALNVVQRATPK